MQLSQQAIEEYKDIILKDYGIKLTDLEATEQATKLINLFKVLAKPVPESKTEPTKNL